MVAEGIDFIVAILTGLVADVLHLGIHILKWTLVGEARVRVGCGSRATFRLDRMQDANANQGGGKGTDRNDRNAKYPRQVARLRRWCAIGHGRLRRRQGGYGVLGRRRRKRGYG